jgi:hypothetical protein
MFSGRLVWDKMFTGFLAGDVPSRHRYSFVLMLILVDSISLSMLLFWAKAANNTYV